MLDLRINEQPAVGFSQRWRKSDCQLVLGYFLYVVVDVVKHAVKKNCTSYWWFFAEYMRTIEPYCVTAERLLGSANFPINDFLLRGDVDMRTGRICLFAQ